MTRENKEKKVSNLGIKETLTIPYPDSKGGVREIRGGEGSMNSLLSRIKKKKKKET